MHSISACLVVLSNLIGVSEWYKVNKLAVHNILAHLYNHNRISNMKCRVRKANKSHGKKVQKTMHRYIIFNEWY